MVDILDQIDNKDLGQTVQGAMPNSFRRLLSRGGLIHGPHGRQINVPANPFRAGDFDDFLGATLNGRWIQQKGTNNPAAPAPLASGIGGVLQIVTGAAGTGLAADENSVVQALQYQPNMGELTSIARLKLSALANVWAFFGFNDNVGAVQIPLQSSGAGNVITAVATNAFGFLYDSRMTSPTWWFCSVNAGGATQSAQCINPVTGAVAPVANQYQTLQVDVDATGFGRPFINGVQVGTGIAAMSAIASPLSAFLGCGKTSAAVANNAQVDFWGASQLRGIDGAAT